MGREKAKGSKICITVSHALSSLHAMKLCNAYECRISTVECQYATAVSAGLQVQSIDGA